MIPELCPLSSRSRLKIVLKGTHDCLGYKEKNDKDVYEKCEVCMKCSFHQIENLEWEWIYFKPSTTIVNPQIVPVTSYTYYTTVSNTSNEFWYTT